MARLPITEMDFLQAQEETFQRCFGCLMNFTCTGEEKGNASLNLLLDELNSVDYSLNIVQPVEANRLLAKLCALVTTDQERLVPKFCQFIFNIVAKQQMTLSESCLLLVVGYLIQAIQQCASWTQPDLLRALSAVLYENVGRVQQFHEDLLGKHGILVQFCLANDEDKLQGALQCMENITVLMACGQAYMEERHLLVCFSIFLRLLHEVPSMKLDRMVLCKILIHALRGLRNVIFSTKIVPGDQLGSLLAGIWAYVFHGMSSNPVNVPPSLQPIPVSQYDPRPSSPPITTNEDKSGMMQPKRIKKKKNLRRAETKEKNDSDVAEAGEALAYSHESSDDRLLCSFMDSKDSARNAIRIHLLGMKISSSESECSDTEGAQTGKVRALCTKVRQMALGCLHDVMKSTDKKVLFGYWSCFVPDTPVIGNTSQVYSLLTTIIRDPSPKCRLSALGTLTALIEGTKSFLAAADDSDQVQAAFTPFSLVLGSTLRELHKSLLLALVSENFPLTLIQLIKCLSTLIANAPYHRLKPGHLTQVVKQVRHLVSHRDPNVRVACLTCLGAVVNIQPPLAEVSYIVQSAKPPSNMALNHSVTESLSGKMADFQILDNTGGSKTKPAEKDSGFSSTADDTSFEALEPVLSFNTSLASSQTSSGIQTPIIGEQSFQVYHTSWLIKLCIRNIVPQQNGVGDSNFVVEPVPVRLESLQILTHLTRNYFSVIRQSVNLLKDLIHQCLEDKDPVVRLHAVKTSLSFCSTLVGFGHNCPLCISTTTFLTSSCSHSSEQLLDELTQVILHDLQNPQQTPSYQKVDHKQAENQMHQKSLDEERSGRKTILGYFVTRSILVKILDFWQYLLSGPLLSILQSVGNNPVRAFACDCLANIGPEILLLLEMNWRILCITLILGLTKDEDKLVMSSAVRTIGVYSLYPCLREDIAFMADAANAILTCMEDSSATVRIKAAWSLANLSDALALNKEADDQEFVEDFSDMLLLKLFTTATKASKDSDKVRSNAVRALGNLLRYLPERTLSKSRFRDEIDEAVGTLVLNTTSGIMKVRWNACYALSNMFKNFLLPHGEAEWSLEVFAKLCSVVESCKNFKVRINAALALSTPTIRKHYGTPKLIVQIWTSLVKALASTEKVTDFTEFKHRDTLVAQICSAVLHLMSLMIPVDLEYLHPYLPEQASILMSHLDRYRQVSPHISNIGLQMKMVNEYHSELTTKSLSELAREALEILQAICFLDIRDESDDQKFEKSAFKQIYD